MRFVRGRLMLPRALAPPTEKMRAWQFASDSIFGIFTAFIQANFLVVNKWKTAEGIRSSELGTVVGVCTGQENLEQYAID